MAHVVLFSAETSLCSVTERQISDMGIVETLDRRSLVAPTLSEARTAATCWDPRASLGFASSI